MLRRIPATAPVVPFLLFEGCINVFGHSPFFSVGGKSFQRNKGLHNSVFSQKRWAISSTPESPPPADSCNNNAKRKVDHVAITDMSGKKASKRRPSNGEVGVSSDETKVIVSHPSSSPKGFILPSAVVPELRKKRKKAVPVETKIMRNAKDSLVVSEKNKNTGEDEHHRELSEEMDSSTSKHTETYSSPSDDSELSSPPTRAEMDPELLSLLIEPAQAFDQKKNAARSAPHQNTRTVKDQHTEASAKGRPPSLQVLENTLSASAVGDSAHRQAYHQLLSETYINPFNGKRLHVESAPAKMLASLGFVRHEENPLFVQWDPDIYLESVRRTLKMLEDKATRQFQKQLQKYEKMDKRNRGKVKKNKRKSSSLDAPEEPKESEPPVLQLPKMSDAVDVLLRPLDKRGRLNRADAEITNELTGGVGAALNGSISWTQELSLLLRSPDALIAVPHYLQQRYADLTTSSVMPPKLDASTTTEVSSSNDAEENTATTLTVDQLNVLRLAQQGCSLFIGGSAGTGKTVLLREIHKNLTQMGLRVAMTATTGVAAVQLGGCTFHHAFNAPIYAGGGLGLGGGAVLSAELWSRRWDQTALRAVDVVMVDEVSLLDAQTFDAFDMEARLARMSSQPFGGIQVIVCGDFLQLSIGLQDALPAYLSTAFTYLMKLRLETPMRHRSGDPLLPLLNEVRRGEFDKKKFAILDKPIPEDTNSSVTTTFIFPRRRDAQRLNEAKLGELITMEKMFAPQRGPLRLSGTFTSSAFMEMINGNSMPQRGKVVDVIREELARILVQQKEALQTESPDTALLLPSSSQILSALSSVSSSFSTLVTDIDVVVMPAQTSSSPTVSSASTSSSFFVRIRYPDGTASPSPHTTTSGEVNGISGSPSNEGNQSSTTVSSVSPSTPPPAEMGNAMTLENTSLEARSPPANSSSASSPSSATSSSYAFSRSTSRRRAGLLQMLLTREVWEHLAPAVASRLGARVVTFFNEEPRGLIPLSVSMALADMTNNDIAQTLTPLRLKLGCRVMVTRNLSRRVSNGSVGTVEAFADPDSTLFPQQQAVFAHRFGSSSSISKTIETECFDKLPIVRLMDGSVVQIPPIPAHIGGSPLTYYYGHDVYAIPLQLGYAFTVHKVQGLTLQGTVVLDCKNFFECPHLVYVACSRVTSMDQLIVKNIRPGMVMVKQSALEFSDTLMPASDAAELEPPPGVARGSWAVTAGYIAQTPPDKL